MHYVIVYSVFDPVSSTYRTHPILRSGTHKEVLEFLIFSCHSENKISTIYPFSDLDRAKSLLHSLL